jgi:predicted Zn-dependent protease
MMRRLLLAAAPLAALAAIGCSDLLYPDRSLRYDWRLIVPFDSAGPRADTLSFHWPRSSLPVRIWVEDQYDMPARVQEGIARWRTAFLYGEWDAVVVSDSTTADVLLRTIVAPPTGFPTAGRLETQFPGCEGATDLDTAATRFQLAVPFRLYVYPKFDPTQVDLTQCFRITATHELGHSLGLFQHSSDSTDVMFGLPVLDGLSLRDVTTAVNAYHYPAALVPVRP